MPSLASPIIWTCPTCRRTAKVPVDYQLVRCVCGSVMDSGGVILVAGQAHSGDAPVTWGPGTELRRILGRCNCSYAWQLDAWGPDGCREHIDTIVGWMIEDGQARDTPISAEAARRMILLAIERSRSQVVELGANQRQIHTEQTEHSSTDANHAEDTASQ